MSSTIHMVIEAANKAAALLQWGCTSIYLVMTGAKEPESNFILITQNAALNENTVQQYTKYTNQFPLRSDLHHYLLQLLNDFFIFVQVRLVRGVNT